MKILRNIIVFFFALGAVSYAGYSFYLHSQSPCQKTLEYSIGRFDPQFGISEEDFKADIVEAGSVWEKAIGRGAFVYDPDANFKINLIYDERQIATIQKQKTESGLLSVETAFKNRDAQFRSFKTQYDQRVAAYEQSFNEYERRKSDYDKEVSLWNGKGGAPQDKYQLLEAERRYLNSEAKRLNEEVASIKTMSDQLNSILSERNSKAAEYNRVAENYNNKYNQGLEFNQAEYTGKEINVYQFGNRQDLILALSHEFGHALNMNHVENPKSIMYYLTGINAESSPTLSDEDLAELHRVCNI